MSAAQAWRQATPCKTPLHKPAYHLALGSTYHGEYSKGMRHGQGVCRYFNGDYYEGQWAQGLREGRGMQQCTDDSNYVGKRPRVFIMLYIHSSPFPLLGLRPVGAC